MSQPQWIAGDSAMACTRRARAKIGGRRWLALVQAQSHYCVTEIQAYKRAKLQALQPRQEELRTHRVSDRIRVRYVHAGTVLSTSRLSLDSTRGTNTYSFGHASIHTLWQVLTEHGDAAAISRTRLLWAGCFQIGASTSFPSTVVPSLAFPTGALHVQKRDEGSAGISCIVMSERQ